MGTTNDTDTKGAPTLLARRREQRDEATAQALEAAADLSAAIATSADPSVPSMRSLIDAMAHAARQASRFAALVADLEDVAEYGATGGR